MVMKLTRRHLELTLLVTAGLLVQSLDANPPRVSRIRVRSAAAAAYLGFNPFDVSVRPVTSVRPVGGAVLEPSLAPAAADYPMPGDGPIYVRPAIRVPYRPAIRSTFRPVF